MKLGELMSLMSCKDGDELFDKIEEILNEFNISVYRKDGTMKNLYKVCCDVAEVLNNNIK